MVEKIYYDQLINSLDKNAQNYGIVQWDNELRLVITQHGGRLLGLFPDASSESLTWLPSEWSNADSAKTMIESDAWNLGGNRCWIAPEVQYNVSDRFDFPGTLSVPSAMDPGNYTLSETVNGGWRLSQSLSITAHNLANGDKMLDVSRVIQKVPDPLRTLSNFERLSDGVRFAGYQQMITLYDRNPNDILSESWDLVQLNPGGQLLIPAAQGIEVGHYVGEVPAEATIVENNHLRINITGNHQFKVGYKSAYLTGRMGYLNQLDGDNHYLMIRCFFSNPSAHYSEEPPEKVGNNGYAVHVYNDDGGLGGFGEMECNGQTIGGATNRISSSDAFITWVYIGALDKLRPVSEILLGVTP